MPSEPLMLIDRDPSEVICHRGGEAVSVRRFLADVSAVADLLPAEGHAVNLCADRYAALVGFAAALTRGHPTLLGGRPGAARPLPDMTAGHYGNVYVLADTPTPDTPGSGTRGSGTRGWDTRTSDTRPSGVFASDAHVPTISGSDTAPSTLPWIRIDIGRLPARDAADVRPMAIPADRIAAIAFTSGSTGVPTAHVKPWGALVTSAAAAVARFGLGAQDGPPTTIVATVPPQHMYGFETTLMLPLQAAVAIHAGASFFPSDVRQALASVPQRRLLITTPLHLRVMLEEGRPPPPLDAVISATAPLSRDMAEAVEREWGTRMLEIYGATEAGSMASRRSATEDTWLPYDGVRVRPGFADVPGLGPVALSDAIEPADHGRFRLLGRLADLVKLGGKRASLAELNRVLAAVPGVEDGVFLAPADIESNPSSRLTAIVVAPGRTTAEIVDVLRGRLDPAFLPRRIAFVAALPRDALGKLPNQALVGLASRAVDA